ncbi:MFS transporter [Gordonia bronchialis]|uniref:MFS transporter n=1 Tax=Gordonia bronchialis TaxID=2054 RepID=UPI0037C15715
MSSVDTSSGAAAPVAIPGSAWTPFLGCLLGVFMQMLDTTIVNIALPDLTTELGASTAEQLFVLSVYTLAFACTLLIGASLGGRFGRRRLFLIAMIAFVVTSALCGLAQSPVELIGWRAAQGVSAALMSAQTLALVAGLFDRSRHGVVFGIYGAVAGLAAILGPLVGGLLISADLLGWGWRTIFFVNVPLGMIACILAGRRLPELRVTDPAAPDLIGAALSTAGLFLLLYPLAVGREQGWGWHLWAMMASSGVALSAFVLVEHRVAARGGTPMLRLDLFTSRRFTTGLVLSLLFFSVFAGFFFTVSVSTQFGLGFSPLRTGLLMLPFAVGAAVGSLLSPFLVTRVGPGATLSAGALGTALGFAWLAMTLDPQTATMSFPMVIAPSVLGGIGTGLFVAPLQAAILSGTSEPNMGSASGCVPTVQQIGASIGLAVVTLFFFTQVSAQAAHAVSTTTAELAVSLNNSSVDPMFRGAVGARFADCATAQLTSAHPDRPAPGCAAPDAGNSNTGESPAGESAVAARIAHEARDQLHAAGRSVAARTFLSAFRTTLWALAGATAVIAVLALSMTRTRPPTAG